MKEADETGSQKAQTGSDSTSAPNRQDATGAQRHSETSADHVNKAAKPADRFLNATVR